MKKNILFVLFIFFFLSINAQSIFIGGFNSLQKATLGTSCSPTTIGLYDATNPFNFHMTDIAFHPNGNLYGVSLTGFYTIDTLTGQATLINTHNLINVVPNGLVSDNSGTMYLSDLQGGFYTLDITTGVATLIATLPTGSAGDLAFYNGVLYMADVNNDLVTINLNANPITTTTVGAMNIGTGQTVFGILTLGTNCQNAQFIGGANSLYTIDPLTAQTTFLCNLGTTIAGISSLYDFIGSDCDLRVDLDDDNSSGALNIDYNIDTSCLNNLYIADTDVNVYSDQGIDSIQVWISGGIQNTNDEILTYTATNNITALQHNNTSVTLVNNGSASFTDFETAILNITYQNNATQIIPGLRTVSVAATYGTLISDTAQTFFHLTNVLSFDLGNDTLLCTNTSLILDATIPNTSIIWEDNSTSPIRTILQAGTYIATITNVCGSISDTINVEDALTQQTFIDTAICSNDGIMIANVMHNMTGNYTYTLQTWQGCDSIVTLDLVVFPTQQTIIDTTICYTDSIIIANVVHNTTGNYTYNLQTWQGCDSTIILNLKVLQPYTLIDTTICGNETIIVNGISHNTTGNYYYTIQSPQGCTYDVELNLTVNPIFDIFLTDTICQFETYQIGQQSFNSTGNYVIPFSSVSGCDSIIHLDLTVIEQDTTTITIEVCDENLVTDLTETYTNSFGCDSTVITKWIYQDGFLNLPDTILCSNENYTIDVSNIATQILWQDGSNDLIYDISNVGIYTVSATNFNGCIDLDTFEVNKLEPIHPNYNLPVDTTKCIGENLILNAYTEGATSYLWTGEQSYYQQNSFTDSTFLITHLFNKQGVFSVEITNQCGGYTQYIEVTEEDCSCEPFIPNVFTPNADGTNDEFEVYSSCELTNFSMTIFDRWGSKIYYTEDINNGWNGTINGQTIGSGVYVYLITFDATDRSGNIETKQRSGSLTLIR